MLKEQIEALREKLNKMAESNNAYEELLKVSQELDILILKFMMEKQKDTYKAL